MLEQHRRCWPALNHHWAEKYRLYRVPCDIVPTLAQCWPTSPTLSQHLAYSGSMSRVYWDSTIEKVHHQSPKIVESLNYDGGGGRFKKQSRGLRILICKDDGLNDAKCHSDLQRQKAVSAYLLTAYLLCAGAGWETGRHRRRWSIALLGPGPCRCIRWSITILGPTLICLHSHTSSVHLIFMHTCHINWRISLKGWVLKLNWLNYCFCCILYSSV